MVAGLIWLVITVLLVGCSVAAATILYLKGYMAGTQREAKGWINAISQLTTPNWQSLPINKEGTDKEQLETANKIYVAAYGVALKVIREEIAANRILSLIQDLDGDDYAASVAARIRTQKVAGLDDRTD